MIIDCAVYRDGRGSIGARCRCRTPRPGAGGRIRLARIVRTQPDELDEVSVAFGLHELAVEDAQKFHLRPKVEAYEGDVRLVILRTARYDDDARGGRLRGDQRLRRATVS